MTNKTDTEILADAPNFANEYNGVDGYSTTMPKPTRSLADLKALAAKGERIAELENELNEAIGIIEHCGIDYDEIVEAIRGDS